MSWNSSSTASMQLQMVSKAKRKLLFFQSRIGNAQVYIYRNKHWHVPCFYGRRCAGTACQQLQCSFGWYLWLKWKKICLFQSFFFKSRIGSSHIYSHSNIIDILHAFITQGVLEQLVNCFNEAAEGICS